MSYIFAFGGGLQDKSVQPFIARDFLIFLYA
ncbi:hypothetical protein M2427_006192 [Bradyrhizobium sp. BR13661]|jgi:hypothetical protein|nr:hypothetical protein [Bradyrhizobium sp. BR13661]